MKHAALILIFLLVFGVSAGVHAQDVTPERTYKVHVSEIYEEGTPAPLLIVLHGAGGQGDRIEAITGFSDIADEAGFIAVYPDGLHYNWDFGVGILTQERTIVRSDDVAFLTGLIDTLAEEYTIDRGRVFVTGFSNGGSMAYYLACQAPEVFAGAAIVAAPLAVSTTQGCSDQPISVMTIHGTLDPILNWDRTYARDGRLVALSATDTVGWWGEHNGCDLEAFEFDELPDTNTEDNSQVRRVSMLDCADDTQAILYGINGGGHTWAGHPFETSFEIGAVNLDIDASRVIWEWFASLPPRDLAAEN